MGSVNTYTEKLAAEAAARRVKGVRAIAQDIKVKLSSEQKVSDQEIAERLARIFEWNAATAGTEIQAAVSKGFVTLTGAVDWNYRREVAKNLAASVRGIVAINNQITVKSRVVPTQVSREIARALHRNADVEASQIKVDVQGGKVTLNGEVKAWYERKLVEAAVWAAPGVTDVVDNIRIA